ncbi:MAG: hypothetical protein JXB23_14810 [Candidatus Aminicenantes bacterium]|nr:hypothetical protein [Candidatus Aminicenantes bacterium]
MNGLVLFCKKSEKVLQWDTCASRKKTCYGTSGCLCADIVKKYGTEKLFSPEIRRISSVEAIKPYIDELTSASEEQQAQARAQPPPQIARTPLPFARDGSRKPIPEFKKSSAFSQTPSDFLREKIIKDAQKAAG